MLIPTTGSSPLCSTLVQERLLLDASALVDGLHRAEEAAAPAALAASRP